MHAGLEATSGYVYHLSSCRRIEHAVAINKLAFIKPRREFELSMIYIKDCEYVKYDTIRVLSTLQNEGSCNML